ncbi:uncharacterized protein K02A2.6-like [Ornithodoros turicata]|uniref:uncharacterized protein K02A2.6-like n=1 Tax=Ornithodoros turicata TaxID=34597 RepID=UPI0031389AAA
MKLKGSVQVRVRWKSKDYLLPLLVVKGTGCSLLGRNWFQPLNIKISGVNNVSAATSIDALLSKFSSVFADPCEGHAGPPVEIELKPDAVPQFRKARPVPFALRGAVERELEKWEKQGFISPVQYSDWATPMVIVRKKDGEIRMCGDYKSTVNAMARKASFPLPTASEVLASLQGGSVFSTLDLAEAYQQLHVTEQTSKILTINTLKGLYAVHRLPFGISAAPAIFQRFMETILAGIPGTSVYLDDVIVAGRTDDEHKQRLEAVLRRLCDANLKLKKSKCHFAMPEVRYLGHRINAEGIHTTEEKVQALLDAPEPTNKAQLQSFLGMLAFCDKFLPDRASTAKDLYELLRKETTWSWEPKHKEAYNNLKQLVNSRIVLAHYDEKKPLLISCDASPYGIGAVLSQPDEHGEEAPLAFTSRTLGQAEQNYCQLDREGLAIIFATAKFHQFIAGRHVTIVTDHKPLLGILGSNRPVPEVLSPRMLRWCLKLAAYDYDLIYRKGSENQNADFMSRLPLESDLDEPNAPADVLMLEGFKSPPLSIKDLQTWTREDDILSDVLKAVQAGTVQKLTEARFRPYVRLASELSTHNGCVIRGSRVVIPPRARRKALDLLHAGHRGIVAAKACARAYMRWPGMDSEIEHQVQDCVICQENRRLPAKAPVPHF